MGCEPLAQRARPAGTPPLPSSSGSPPHPPRLPVQKYWGFSALCLFAATEGGCGPADSQARALSHAQLGTGGNEEMCSYLWEIFSL